MRFESEAGVSRRISGTCVDSRVPLVVAAGALFEGFQSRPDLLGECTDFESYIRWFMRTHIYAWSRDRAWIVTREGPRPDHLELHVYAFDHRLRNKIPWFREVLTEMQALGYSRITTVLTPSAGNTVRAVLRACGFNREGIMSGYFRTGTPPVYTSGELWATLLKGDQDGRLEH